MNNKNKVNKKFKLKTGDNVVVIAGKSKGHIGEIIKVDTEKQRVIVEGANIAVKHQKPTQQNQGGRIKKPLSIHISNVAFYDEKEQKASRIGYAFDGGHGKENKKRISKVSGEFV